MSRKRKSKGRKKRKQHSPPTKTSGPPLDLNLLLRSQDAVNKLGSRGPTRKAARSLKKVDRWVRQQQKAQE